MKTPKERTNLDLLELTLQLHSRALNNLSLDMHRSYMEARQELELRLEQKLNKPVFSGKRQLIEKILFDYMENTKTYNETVNRILAACVNGAVDTVAERRLLPHQVYCSDCGYVMPKSYFKIHNCAGLREGQP